MPPIHALALWFLAAAALPGNARQQQRLEEEIERVVVLPRGASPLTAYGRNYARSGDEVVAVYLIPWSPPAASEGCEVMKKESLSRPCTKQEIQEAAKADGLGLSASAPAGTTRWYRRIQELPGILDGGCMQVNVRYRISTHNILSIACNGLA